MKTYIWILSTIYLLTMGSNGVAQQKQIYAKNLEAYVGTWEYRSDTEYFKIVLKKGRENTWQFMGDCIIGGYLYQKNGQTIADYALNIPLEFTDYKDTSLKIRATNAYSNPEKVNPNELRLYFYDDKVGYRTMQGNIELLSPTKIRWILRHPLSEFASGPAAERDLYTVPTDVEMTKVQ